MTNISYILDDITTLNVDVIVNAAHSSLLGGGGVDGAIHEAAGPQLLEACRLLNGCPTGEAKITQAYQLPCKYVIHTVGPVYGQHNGDEAQLLSNCYTNSLLLAKQYRLKSIAFPAISCGAYGYPWSEAAQIANQSVQKFVSQNQVISDIIFCLFSNEIYESFSSYHTKNL